jgi:hypothetical protein
MLDLMTIRAKDDALANLLKDRLTGKTAPNHVRDVEVLLLSARVVELKGAIVGETTSAALEGLLVIVKPPPQGSATFVGFRPLAALAPQPAISLAFDDSANLESLFWLLEVAILADQHDSLPFCSQVTTNPIGQSSE